MYHSKQWFLKYVHALHIYSFICNCGIFQSCPVEGSETKSVCAPTARAFI